MQKEVSKLMKRISAEKLRNNHKECIELYNMVGGLYSEVGSYDEAAYYHEQALQFSKTIGDRLATCHCLRFIGECKASLGQFYQAIDYIKKYLELAQRICNKLESQRAFTTLGRVYLMQAEDIKENEGVKAEEQYKETAREAEKRFQTALTMASSLKAQVDEKEFAQMQSGLFINMGLVKEICNQHGESVINFNKAIDICRAAKLKENLYRCQIILAAIFRQRYNIKMAVKTSDEALVTAKQIGKKLLICDALIERGLVKIWQKDFKNGKRLFAQAYLEKSPCEEDHFKAIRLTKLAHLIATNYDKLRDDIASEMKMKICDKLGDLFVAIKFYRMAIEFYKREFADARVNSKPRNELARIIYSIAETYADDGQFEHALVCYEKEIAYRNDQSPEQCQSYIKVAHMREYLGQESQKVCDSYELALDKAGKSPRMMYAVLKDYSSYLKRKCDRPTRLREVESILANLRAYPEVIRDIDMEGEEVDSMDLEEEIPNVEDIITDDEENDEVLMLGRKRATVRGAKKFKSNEVGDTPLHEACIKGDLKRVKSLIGQGHQVNPRDNAGWIPLHEACNHGHYEIADYLIENGADVNYRGLKGMTPLHDAATNGHYNIMRLLIKSGANVIALTDTGETVLSCLKDYRKRNQADMSNRDQSEYKAMEVELLNAMDRCGFDLMEESRSKRTNGPVAGPSRVNSLNIAFVEQSAGRPVTVRTNKRVDVQEPVNVTNPVNQYREVIGILKRKRPESGESSSSKNKKANLPATYEAESYNPSAPTKDWLVDDVSRNKLTTTQTSLQDLFPDDYEDEDNGQKEPEVLEHFSDVVNYPSNARRRRVGNDRSLGASISHRLDSDDDDDDEVQVIGSPPRSPQLPDDRPVSSYSPPIEEPIEARPKVLDEPLRVEIEGRRLVVPVRDDWATISWLQEAVSERYEAVVGAKAKVTLAPASDPQCMYYAADLCKDVIRDNMLLARIEKWQLEPIEQVYINECELNKLEPLSCVRAELGKLYTSNKLNLSHTRVPAKHAKPALKAMMRRDITHADLRGAFSLFETTELAKYALNEVVCSWRSLIHLDLSCVGLRSCHFETICGGVTDSCEAVEKQSVESHSQLGKLESLNLSSNVIAYKSRCEFKCQLEILLRTSLRLKRLDLRYNCLQFMKSIGAQATPDEEQHISQTSADSGDDPQGTEERRTTQSLCSCLGLKLDGKREFIMLLSKQRDYTLYN